MNNVDFTINMHKDDYFALPPEMRQISNGAMVLTVVKGRETFVRVNMLE